MPVMRRELDVRSDVCLHACPRTLTPVTDLKSRQRRVQQGGAAATAELHQAHVGFAVRERLTLLLEWRGGFCELCRFAGWGSGDPRGGGLVMGIGGNVRETADRRRQGSDRSTRVFVPDRDREDRARVWLARQVIARLPGVEAPLRGGPPSLTRTTRCFGYSRLHGWRRRRSDAVRALATSSMERSSIKRKEL
jgi:hypothetical protein